jgi:MacB-like periplasmic core domain
VQGRVVVSLNRPPATYTPPKLAALHREIETRLNLLPGVRGSGRALCNPLTDNWGELVLVAGHPAPKMNEDAGASWHRVSANYLQTFGMTMVRGRAFTAADNETTAPVAIVNEAFVRRFFTSSEDPLAQHFGLDLPENVGTLRIVGIVRDAKFAGWGLNRPARPMFFVPLAQTVDCKNDLVKRIELQSHFGTGLVLATDVSPGALEPLLTKTLADIDPNLTITSVRTMSEQVERSFDQERAVASLAGLFGIVALALAAVGLYGVSFWDPSALVIAAGALAACALVAALIPAGRAASISPVSALRTE